MTVSTHILELRSHTTVIYFFLCSILLPSSSLLSMFACVLKYSGHTAWLHAFLLRVTYFCIMAIHSHTKTMLTECAMVVFSDILAACSSMCVISKYVKIIYFFIIIIFIYCFAGVHCDIYKSSYNIS
jgi:hypothetical protein